MSPQVWSQIAGTIWEVFRALAPLAILLAVVQVAFLRLPRRKMTQLATGLLLTFLGLVLFLEGVHIGFLPTGDRIGRMLGSLQHSWTLIPIGFVLGYSIALAEPAVRVLNHEVEKASSGYIPQRLLLHTLALGVAAAVSLAMARVVFGIPLWWLIIPGYGIAIAMTRYSARAFVAIAFDAGGVATGPMTVAFVLTMALGAASAMDARSPLIDGFGVISLVALAPILSVLGLGLLYRRRETAGRKTAHSVCDREGS